MWSTAGYGGLLIFDPLNIRYATDSTNMQLWNTHNPFRAVLVCADGYMVIWDYKNAPFLTPSTRWCARRAPARTCSISTGATRWTMAADALSPRGARADRREHAPGRAWRLAVDKPMLHALRALEAQGFEIMEGEEVTEKARSVKGPDEIKAMRCAIHACEAAMPRWRLRPRTWCRRGTSVGKRHLGGAARREHPPRRRMDRDAAADHRGRAPTRGSRNAGPGSCRTTRSSPSTPI
jgi:Xaa-Pro aminopeptidase